MESIHRVHCRYVAFRLRIVQHGILVVSCMCIEMRLIWRLVWRLVLRLVLPSESILRGLRAHLLDSI
jgi:hypothetical protein